MCIQSIALECFLVCLCQIIWFQYVNCLYILTSCFVLKSSWSIKEMNSVCPSGSQYHDVQLKLCGGGRWEITKLKGGSGILREEALWHAEPSSVWETRTDTLLNSCSHTCILWCKVLLCKPHPAVGVEHWALPVSVYSCIIEAELNPNVLDPKRFRGMNAPSEFTYHENTRGKKKDTFYSVQLVCLLKLFIVLCLQSLHWENEFQ